MGFPERIRRREIEKAAGCAVCRQPFLPDSYIELHSATGLHLVLDEDSDQTRFIVTDPPQGHQYLKGRSISAKAYKMGDRRRHDGFCVCPECHDGLKLKALDEARRRDPKFRGNVPPPQVMEDVTLEMVKRGKPIVFHKTNPR